MQCSWKRNPEKQADHKTLGHKTLLCKQTLNIFKRDAPTYQSGVKKKYFLSIAKLAWPFGCLRDCFDIRGLEEGQSTFCVILNDEKSFAFT